jgi:hypothetical protein
LEVRVPYTHSAGLKMTKIMLADYSVNESLMEIAEYEQSIARFLVPNIKKSYKTDDPVVVYFEVYNLKKNTSGQTNFYVQLTLSQIRKDPSFLIRLYGIIKSVFINETFSQITLRDDYSGIRRDDYITRILSLPESYPGVYSLDITVYDNLARTGVTERVEFSIIQ